MQERFHQPLNAPELGPCVCAQVRRVARKLSSFYDAVLAAEDLTVTQFSLLANIARAGHLSHTSLAEKVGMDRTTLTRNLQPLIRAGWVTVGTGEDRRQHLVRLTTEGKRKLARSSPLWEEAQRQFLARIGSESLQQLRATLSSVEMAVPNACSAKQPDPKGASLRVGKEPSHAPRSN